MLFPWEFSLLRLKNEGLEEDSLFWYRKMTSYYHVQSSITFFITFSWLIVYATKTTAEINICPQNQSIAGKMSHNTHCWTLEVYLLTNNITSNTTLILEDGQHLIQNTMEVSNVSNIVIMGGSNVTATINCNKSAALSFRFCSNVTLKNVYITECGCQSADGAVSFYYGMNVSLVKVTISDSFKSALKVNNVKGLLLLNSCTLKDVEPDNSANNKYLVGNAVTYNYCDDIESKFVALTSVFSNSRYSNNPGSTTGLTVSVISAYY